MRSRGESLPAFEGELKKIEISSGVGVCYGLQPPPEEERSQEVSITAGGSVIRSSARTRSGTVTTAS